MPGYIEVFFLFIIVRAVRFIAKKSWFIAGCDDLNLQVYNYNTMEEVL